MRTPPIAPKDVTKEQLYEFIAYILTQSVDCPWSIKQAEMIGKAFMDKGNFDATITKALVSSIDIGPASVIVSTFVAGFQTGREFENRIMAKAMRDEAAAKPLEPRPQVG